MLTVVQRVRSASVTVGDDTIARIEQGVLALVAVQPDDDAARARRLADRILGYRMFADASGRMNASVVDVAGGVLLVPQFTLAADTRRGLRPGFSTAAPPELARALFETCADHARSRHDAVQTGRFGADMAVALVNDGPVTFQLAA